METKKILKKSNNFKIDDETLKKTAKVEQLHMETQFLIENKKGIMVGQICKKVN